MAKRKSIMCPKCDRTFLMAAHLGRHMSTMHAPKGTRVALAVKAKVGPRPSATPGLGGADGLAAVGSSIQRYRDELAAQRAALDAQVAALDQALAALGGSVASVQVRRGGRRSPAFRAGTLPAYIGRVLHAHRGAMAVQEVTAAVLKAGYKSRDKALPKTVGKYLAAMPGVKRIGHGLYRAK